MKSFAIAGLMALTAILVGIVAGGRPAASIDQGGCWVNGAGYVDIAAGQSDAFGGNGMTMKSGSVIGQWQHTTYLGDVFHGEVQYVVCRAELGPGPGVPEGVNNYANWGGTGRWNGLEGYSFDVKAFDRGEPGIGADSYSIAVYDPAGNTVYSVPYDTPISGGNIQIQPPNNGHPY